MNIISEAFSIFEAGGWVMYPLVAMAALMWYGIAYRWMLLQLPKELSRSNMKSTVQKAVYNQLPGNLLEDENYLSQALKAGKEIYKKRPQDLDLALQTQVVKISEDASQYKQLVASCVAVTPLLGLLGTVMGMIETFDALADNVLYSQSGGIASGISAALLTTELGLVIAVPGLIVSKLLERRQEEIGSRIEQIAEIIKVQVEGHKGVKA